MEAASATVGPARPRGSDRVRDLLSRYGLIAALLFLPVLFAMGDLLGWESKEFLEFSNERNLSQLGNNLLDGLSNGAIWALVALGYTLVYGIVELINFAHGEVFMIGSFVAAGLFGTLGLTAATGAIGLILGLDADADRLHGRVGLAQHDDRAGGLQAAARRAQARAADHGRRVLVHPAERGAPVARRRAAGSART